MIYVVTLSWLLWQHVLCIVWVVYCSEWAWLWMCVVRRIRRTTRHMYLQHDGAPIHYTRKVIQHLNNTYPNRWIGRGSLIHWPARSPDLTPLDFCLWGWLKGEVYRTKVDTCADLVARINNACVHIKDRRHELRRATRSSLQHVDKSIEVGGGIFENLLWDVPDVYGPGFCPLQIISNTGQPGLQT